MKPHESATSGPAGATKVEGSQEESAHRDLSSSSSSSVDATARLIEIEQVSVRARKQLGDALVALNDYRADRKRHSYQPHSLVLLAEASVRLAIDALEAQPVSAESQSDWQVDCLKWRGRLLTGRQGHWCAEWDDLPVDETCSEWPCDCAFQRAVEEATLDPARLKPVNEGTAIGSATPDCNSSSVPESMPTPTWRLFDALVDAVTHCQACDGKGFYWFGGNVRGNIDCARCRSWRDALEVAR